MRKSDDPTVPTVATRVGHARWGDNSFRGKSVATDLAGRVGLWDVASLAVDGPTLCEEDAGVLDDIMACGLAADPRIWPLKIARLASAFGNDSAGLCAGILGTDRSFVGAYPVGRLAQLLVEIGGRLDQGESLEDEVARVIAQHQRFPGFGVPFRDEDERVVALRRCIVARGRDHGRYWLLVHAIEGHLSKVHTLPPNFAAAMGSALLDLGFSAEQIVPVAELALLPNFLANAYEGAQLRPAVLQRLPDAVVEYVGPPPRESPRARAAREAAEANAARPSPQELEPEL